MAYNQGPVVQPPPRKPLVWPYIVAAVVIGPCLLFSVCSVLLPERDYGPSKMEMAGRITVGTKTSDLIEVFGEPSERNREPGIVPTETWTYPTYDGGVVVTVKYGSMVSDVFTY